VYIRRDLLSFSFKLLSMRKFSPFTPLQHSPPAMESPSSSCPQVTFSTPSTSTKHRSRHLFSGLKGMLRRSRRNDKTFDNTDEFPPPLPVDAASTIKRARRQTCECYLPPSLFSMIILNRVLSISKKMSCTRLPRSKYRDPLPS